MLSAAHYPVRPPTAVPARFLIPEIGFLPPGSPRLRHLGFPTPVLRSTGSLASATSSSMLRTPSNRGGSRLESARGRVRVQFFDVALRETVFDGGLEEPGPAQGGACGPIQNDPLLHSHRRTPRASSDHAPPEVQREGERPSFERPGELGMARVPLPARGLRRRGVDPQSSVGPAA
jgi:hypothetical protein